ncbi:MAG TPA: hypothetical protein VE988_08870, partial [Gemmataceae bacterium]|nr:hypothetical protein [Gemmataceae bacterium]
LLDAGHSDPLTLREVMEYGDSEGDVVIINHEGVEFRLGSDFFAWAFEVSLWHHARANHIEPVFESQEQKAAWDAFFDQAGAYTPTRTDLDVPHPHWDVPFHLVSGVKVGNVQLVGSIGG